MKIETPNDNLMVMAMHRYCFGRASYIVSVCIQWLLSHWNQISEDTQIIILRDTLEGLSKDRGGMDMDIKAWKIFLKKILPEMDRLQRAHLLTQLRGTDVNLEDYL